MDDNQSVSDELHRLQSNIASLFESLLNEKNKFKHEKENSISCIETLVNEVTNLRKENELLRKSNGEKRRSCETCVELKEKLAVQNRRCAKQEKNLNALRKFINENPNKFVSSQFPKLLIKLLNECDESQGKVPGQKDTNFLRSASKDNTESLIEEQACDIVQKLPKPDEFNSDGYVRTKSEKINDEQPKEQRSSEDVNNPRIKTEGGEAGIELICSGSKRVGELVEDKFRTPKKVDTSDADFIDSPFCILPVKKGDESPILFNRPQGASPNQFKRKAGELGSGSLGKAVEKKLFLKSPNRKTYRSPAKGSKSKFTSQLKFTNSVEAEISLGGVRKLKQTQLNFEFYKSKNDEENNAHAGNASGRDLSHEANDDENKFGEDDVILGSPKHSGNLFNSFTKNFRMCEKENDKNHSKSTTKLAVDPDETFVNSFYLEDCMRNGSEKSKSTTKSPAKIPTRSPEYNSVPYLYKGSPVRKKSERMKLPGQMCMDCNKYYEAILGEIDQGKMQEILNQCSRHRDKHYNVVQTPPGYWKPYLTATMDSTMQDDDTSSDE